MTESQAQQLLPDGVYATFNYSCNVCGGTVSVQNSMRQPHTCGGDGVPALDLPAIRALLEAHHEGVEYGDDIPEGEMEEVPEDYERHYCHEDGEDWPCAAFIAAAPSIVAQLVAVVEAGLAACETVIDNTDGHKPPGPPHPSREQATAMRIRAAITGEGQ